mgnify:CR=1 FL=1
MVNYGDCIVFLLAKAYQQAHLHLKKHLLPYGLTPVQYLVLEAISEEEGLSATEIGRKVSLDSATLSGILDRLTERHWILKELDPQDRRSLRLYLGEKTKSSREEMVGVRERSNAEILEGFSIEERVLLKRLLKDLSRYGFTDRSI